MMETRSTERDAIWLAVVNCIRRDFPNSSMARHLSDEQALLTAASWADHLEHIPPRRVMKIYKALAMGAKNPPVISDFAAAWSEIADREWRQNQDEKRKREDAELRRQHENGVGRIGLKVYQLARKRLEAGLDAVCCDCTKDGAGVIATLTHDGKYFCCQQRACDFCQPVNKLMQIRVHPLFKGVGNLYQAKSTEPATRTTPSAAIAPKSQKNLLDDDEIVQQLESRCEMNCKTIGYECAVEFGKYLLKIKPTLTSWSREVAKQIWQEFQEVNHANI